MESNDMLSTRTAYEVMLCFLRQYWEFTGSTDLTDILSGGEYLSDSLPADSAFWEYWLDAIEKVKRQGPIHKSMQ